MLITYDIESESIVATTQKEITLVDGFNAGNSLICDFKNNYLLLIGHVLSSSVASLEIIVLNAVNLEQVWRKEASVPPVSFNAQDKSNLQTKNSPISSDFFRTAYGVKTCALGDNSGWIAIFGMKSEHIAFNMEGLFEIDTTGNIDFHQGNNQSVSQMVCDSKSNDVLILQEDLYKATGKKIRIFNGILNWKKEGGLSTIIHREEKLLINNRKIVPLSIARNSNTLLIAPTHYSNSYTDTPSEIETFGATSVEVTGMLTIPLFWHKDQSKTVQKRIEWLRGL